MVSESLARRFRPAGFEQPEGSRQNYVKPRPELQEAFYQWIEELPERLSYEYAEEEYDKVIKSLEGFGEINSRESNALLLDFEPKNDAQKWAGIFISACYAHSEEKIIVFDSDSPEINFIGYKTKKIISNNGKVGDWFASNSSGVIVNNGECEDVFAMDSSCIAINNGLAREDFARWSSGIVINNNSCSYGFAEDSSGIVISAKELEDCEWKKERQMIKPADLEKIPELRQYLKELEEITRSLKDEESAKRFIERYGVSGEKIKTDIEDILRGGGFKI